jgi:hypothetical protein
MKALFVISAKWDTCLEWITKWHYPELRGYFTLKSLLHSGLKQVMSLFTLGSTRAVLVVALAYSFPDVFNVIMALISPYTNQPFIVPIRRTSIVFWDHPSQWHQGCRKGYNKQIQVSFDSNICIGVFSQFQLHTRSCTQLPWRALTPMRLVKEWILMLFIKKTIN